MGLVSLLLEALPTAIQIFKKDDKPTVGFKHLLIKSDDQIESFLKYDYSFLDDFSSKKIYLLENDVFKFGQSNFRKSITRKTYSGWSDTPYRELAEKEPDKFTKHYDLDDLNDVIYNHDKNISGRILDELSSKGLDFDYSDFARHNIYDFHCHGTVHEVFDFRAMWMVVLWIENLSQSPIPLESISGLKYETNIGLEYRSFDDESGRIESINYPSNQLQPKENLLVPEFFLMSPIGKSEITETSDLKATNWNFGEKSCSYSSLEISSSEKFDVIGPSFKVDNIKTKKDKIEVHRLDLKNLITINEYLNFGCCPYVFGINSDDSVDFLGDILTNKYAKIDIHDYIKVIIWELEEEVTYIEKIIADGRTIARDKILTKNEYISINNETNHISTIEIFGHYEAENGYTDSLTNFSCKHNLIMDTLNLLSA
jgi:hypothetical protein